MDLIAIFRGIRPDNVGQEIFNKLNTRFPPESQNSNTYNKKTIYKSRDFYEITSMLSDAGLSAWDRRNERNNLLEYTLYIKRVYSDYDISESSILLMYGYNSNSVSVDLALELQDAAGTPMLVGSRVLKQRKMLVGAHNGGFACWVLMAEHVRHVLEKGDFRGIRFDPTRVYEKVGDRDYRAQTWDEYPEPWWELGSDLTMPALSPAVNLVAAKHGTELQPDFSTGCRIDDGLFVPAELHYRHADIERMGEFDVARTLEPITGYLGWTHRDRPLIVSQRFYQHCKKHKIKAEWWPVRIDED